MRDARGVRGDRVCSNERMLSDLVVMKSSYLSHSPLLQAGAGTIRPRDASSAATRPVSGRCGKDEAT